MLVVKDAIEKRRSIRRFKPDPIPEEYLKAILESAWLAPSGSNSQPWRFLVSTDPQEKRQLRDLAFSQKFIEEAAAVFICCADLEAYSAEQRSARRDEMSLIGILEDLAGSDIVERVANLDVKSAPQLFLQQAVLNCGIAVEHMVLTATSLGLGSCWVGGFDGRGIRKLFGLPKNIIVLALLPVGYPAQDPPRRPRIPFEQILLRPIAANGSAPGE